MAKDTLVVCRICGLSKPHTDPRAIAYHKDQVKRNRQALRDWRKREEENLYKKGD